ncbi:MAG: nucleotidyltransferase domain-containing protein [bacterium]
MGITKEQIEKTIAIAKKYGAKKLILFGSVLEESGQARDIDLACDGIDGWKLFEFGGILEQELHLSVDIIPLKPGTRFTRYIETKGRSLL